jgi:predicted nucleotidyltransferase
MVEMGKVKEEGQEILRVLCGSRAYGLEHDKSDYDFHGIFVVPTEKLLTPWVKIEPVSWVEGDEDNTAWEVGHFLKLAITSNPTVLETLKAPVVKHNGWGDAVRKLFPAVISKERAFQSFFHYGSKQRKKFLERKDDRPMKFAVSLIRVLLHGIELLDTGDYNPNLKKSPNPDVVEMLHEIRRGEWQFGRIVEWSIQLEDRLKCAYDKSTVQEEPDFEKIEHTLMQIRKAYFN